MATNELIIEKYRELVKKLDDELENNYGQRRGYQQLRSEIAALESQAKEPSDEDIAEWSQDQWAVQTLFNYKGNGADLICMGAKAMRDGKIKTQTK